MGQHIPISDETREVLVEAAADMLAARWTKSNIKRELRKLLEAVNCTWCHQYAEAIISEAKALMRPESREDARGKAVALYERIIRECEDPRIMIMAQQRLDELLGLEAKHDKVDDVEEKVAAVRRALSALENAFTSDEPEAGEGPA